MKYMVTIEFRYNTPEEENDDVCTSHYREKTVTLGIHGTIEDACIQGNKVLETLEKRFPLNPHYNKKNRLSAKKTLVSNLAYILTPFPFFLKISKLEYDNVDTVVSSILHDMGIDNRY